MSSLRSSAGMLTLATTLTASASPLFAGIVFEKSYEKAVRRAQKEHRAIMIDFRAEWCGWCHRLDKTTYRDDRVAEIVAESFVAVKVDTEGSQEEQRIATDYNVRDLPTIIFISPTGTMVHRVDGFQGPGQFPETLETARDLANRVMSYEASIEKNDDDALALFALGNHLFERALYAGAEKLLLRAIQSDSQSPMSYRKKARMDLAVIANAGRRYDEAETRLLEGLNLGPSAEYDPRLLYLQAINYLSWGRPAQARALLLKILDLHPGSPMASRAAKTLSSLNR
jgi:thioredoxin-related protein